MRDRDVRKALHSQVLREYRKQPDTLVLDELGLRHGLCRIDVAVVNGRLHGFEIKSDSDTLNRLSNQLDVYNRVLDRATLVVGVRHADKAAQQIPHWWGIKIAYSGARGAVSILTERSASSNPCVEALAVAELLWRPEVSILLSRIGAPKSILRKPRAWQYKCLVESISLDELRLLTREALKARVTWRGHRPPSTGVD